MSACTFRTAEDYRDHLPCDRCEPKAEDTKNPSYYSSLSPEPVDVAVAWGLNYPKARALTYIARAGRKPGVSEVDDLTKAIGMLEKALKIAEGNK